MPTDARQAAETIEQWMLAIVSDGGVSRFDCLHIDKIDLAWKHKGQWIEGGFEALRIGIAVRNRCELPFVVSLGFSLESGDQPRGIDFRNKQELWARLDWSPPSLYLFRPGEEPTQTVLAEVQHLDPVILGEESGLGCYYLEFRQPGAVEYCRSVFVEG